MARSDSTTADSRITLEGYLAALVSRSVTQHGVSRVTAQRAADAARRHLSAGIGEGVLTPKDRARVRAYHAAVIRRHAVSARDPLDREYRMRLRVATLADDLRRAGLGIDAIRREAAEFYGTEALAYLPAAVA